MGALPGEGVEIERHGGDKGFALAGGHLRDLPLMQHDTADKLDIVRDHLPFELQAGDIPRLAYMPTTGLFDHGECFGQYFLELLLQPFAMRFAV